MKFSRLIHLSLTLAATNLAPPAFAQSTPVPSIIEAWRHAVGTATRHGTLHQRFTAKEEDVSATVDQWITPSGILRRDTERDFDSNELLVTPAIAQTRDWNGFVRSLDGVELARRRSEAFIAAVIAFGPAAAMDQATLTSTSEPHSVALLFTPSHGISIKWIIDQDTSLPVQTIIRGTEADQVTTYSEWQHSGGVFTPQHIVIKERDKPDSDYHIAALVQFEPAGASTFAPIKQEGSDVIMAKSSVKLPFSMEANHIILQARVNGTAPIGFLVDTGDDHESINTPRAAAFKLSSYGATASYGGGNLAQFSFASGASFTFPGMELHNQHVDLLDQTGLEKALGIPLGGILGYDFLSRFIVEIDYEAKIMTLHKPSAWQYTGHGFVVPITFDSGIPYFETQISVPTQPAIPARMCMDFGAADTMTFNSPFVQKHSLVRLAGTDTRATKPAGLENQFFAQTNMRGHIDEFRVGGLVARSIPVSLSANTSGAYSDDIFDGTVGEGIYTRYHVFLDYPRHRVIFEPTAKTSAPFPERKTFGLNLIANGDDLHIFLVTGIRAGSPAEKEGFLKGDIITGLDGKPATNFTLGQLRDTLLRTDETHNFKILRAGKQISILATIAVVSIDQKPS
jgi:Aspartyl protease/PDZ domain